MANEFNFARAPFVNERLPRAVVVLAIAAVAAVTLLHGFLLTRYLLREQEALDVRVADQRREISDTDARIAAAQGSLARNRTELGSVQTEFLTTLFRRKSFSWTDLFNELEKITPPSVRITSIAPAEEEGEITVTMTVVGQTLKDVLELVRGLESSSFFATIYPVDEANLENEDRGETGIAATLRLDYVEDVREPGGPSLEGPGAQRMPEPAETPEEEVPSDFVGPVKPVEPAEEGPR